MSDFDRDGVPPPVDREPVRERETTIIHTDSGDRSGGGGLILAVVLLVAVAALLFYLFGGGLNRAADEVGVNVNVEAPELKIPDVEVNVPEIKVPDIDVKAEDSDGNKAK
jgi:hypothetical protein